MECIELRLAVVLFELFMGCCGWWCLGDGSTLSAEYSRESCLCTTKLVTVSVVGTAAGRTPHV